MNEPIIVFPIYHATSLFLKFIIEFRNTNNNKIIIIDDGIDMESKIILQKVKNQISDVEIIEHAVNLGFGQCIKTGLNYFLVNYSNSSAGIILVNIVNGLVPSDITEYSETLLSNPDKVIIGKLEKNKVGSVEKICRGFFSCTTPIKGGGFQSQMLGIPTTSIIDLIKFKIEDEELGMDTLAKLSKKKDNVVTIPIHHEQTTTIRSPLRIFSDSPKLFFTLSRFSLLSFTTAIIDYSVFAAFFQFSGIIFLSIVFSRLIAGIYQFTLGKFWVFKSSKKSIIEIIKYSILVIVLMLISYGLTTVMVIYLGLNTYLSKLIAEAVLFFMNFATQKTFIFSSSLDFKSTDWNNYYRTPIKTSSLSRKITGNKILQIFQEYQKQPVENICELGGGNSCFFSRIHQQYPDSIYTVIDNNQFGLDLFKLNNNQNPNIRIKNEDILTQRSPTNQMDIVFSVGLIEHFDKEGTAKAIVDHFNRSKPSSLVVITFPTPTWLYNFARGLITLLGFWPFPDERPLTFKEVIDTAQQHGDLLKTSINWPIIFTQGIAVFRKR